MRKKEARLIIAFYGTHDAMSFEEFCLSRGIPGRLIPLPSAISAGCGLAWSAPPEVREEMTAWLLEAGIRPQQLAVLFI